jgi:ribonuclease J
MKDRKIMANDGIVVVIANIDINNNKLLGNPNITTRGFVQVNENQEMLRKLEEIAKHAINLKITKQINYAEIKSQIISELSDYINLTTGRKPIILPVIMNIKKESK